MLTLDHIAGKKMSYWFDDGLGMLEKWAKDNKCDGIEGIGRAGFWNWIKDKNWEKTSIFVEYNFEENK